MCGLQPRRPAALCCRTLLPRSSKPPPHCALRIHRRTTALWDIRVRMCHPDLIISGPASARGLAVLCGWGGSKLKNVNKYASLWHKLGWRTAAASMSMDNTFFPASWTTMPNLTRIISRECRAHRASRTDSLLVSHAFSNGGTFLQLSLMAAHEAERSRAPLRFDGSVYDSGPSSYKRLLPLGAPFVLASSGMPASEIAPLLLRHLPYSLAAALADPLTAAAGGSLPPPLGLFGRLFTTDGNPLRPELYVYGERDFIIPPAQVEAFMEIRRGLGVPVSALGPLAGSPHCAHLRTHPEEYAKALEAFTRSLEQGAPASTSRDSGRCVKK